MNKEAEIYLPAGALYPDDLKLRHGVLEVARNDGFRTGLMLIIRGPQGLTPEAVQKQLDNLSDYARLGEKERPVLFLMHPNKPLTGPQRLNFLDNPEWSQDYVEQSVEVVAKLPSEFTPKTGRAVSFHLNSLVTPFEWVANQDYYEKEFEVVLDKIRQISAFAARYNVHIAVETVPVPEFGDMGRSEKTLLEDGKTYMDQLGNPWPLFPWRKEIAKLRETGSKLAIDWCHSFIAMSTVSEVKKLAEQGKLKEAMATYMVFESDLTHSDDVYNFSNTVLDITQSGDIWHVNDANGIYKTTQLQGEQKNFEEGVNLFEGDIPKEHLMRLVKEGLNRPIKFVLEIHETDFQSNPNTRASLARVLQNQG